MLETANPIGICNLGRFQGKKIGMKIGILVAPIFATVMSAGFPGSSNAAENGPTVHPQVVCPGDDITITEPTEFGLSLAVRTPDRFHLILADHGFATVVPDYWTSHSVSLKVTDLIGFDYNEHGPYVRAVFNVPGVYEFYFAKNLETESENTVSFTRTVEFFEADHPNCH